MNKFNNKKKKLRKASRAYLENLREIENHAKFMTSLAEDAFAELEEAISRIEEEEDEEDPPSSTLSVLRSMFKDASEGKKIFFTP